LKGLKGLKKFEGLPVPERYLMAKPEMGEKAMSTAKMGR